MKTHLKDKPKKKISETFLRFAAPVLSAMPEGAKPSEIENVLRVPHMIWNARVLDQASGTTDWLTRDRQTISYSPGGIAVVEGLIDRKRRLFADDNLLKGGKAMRIITSILAPLAMASFSFYSSNAAGYDRTYGVPAESKRCIVEGRFSCVEYERVYSIQGIQCVEDCVLLNNLNKCKISNHCVWDAGSGCFRKRVCREISNVGSCRRWVEEVICK